VLEDYIANGRDKSKTARLRGVARCTFRNQIEAALRLFGDVTEPPPPKDTPASEASSEASSEEPKATAYTRQNEAEAELRALRVELASLKKESLSHDYIKHKIIGMTREPAPPPTWLIDTTSFPRTSPGVPTLFASDWHWAEVVDPSQVGGVNEYNIAIAHQRARKLITGAIDLLMNHIASPTYPGIVFPLGGDMVTGNIHEELIATNEFEIMPAVLDIFGVLTWCITTLADTFGKVFIPCVSGNHGRDTHKIRMKGRNFTSFDWLIYCFLAKRFEDDSRITFHIPNGSDALYRVYHHRYLLTHGDQFRGGDGMIGALGPLIRGDHRKRGRQAQIGAAYDTMLVGHWHQYVSLERLIVNGSLKGYDEYAMQSNFGFEKPRQALWLTHPEQGITFAMPVNVGEIVKPPETGWVAWTV
jgi:hypothetical protein